MRSRRPLFGRLTLRQLETVAVVAPMAFLGAVYVLVLGPVHPVFHEWPGFLGLALVLAAGVWVFSRSVFGAVRALQAEVESLSAERQRHNQGLVQLHAANLALMRETQVDAALRRTPELGVRLTGGCHAVLAVPGTETGGDRRFVSAAPGRRERSGCALDPALTADRTATPPAHAAGRVLTVQLAHLGRAIGTLAVARDGEAEPFTPIDEEVARMFATHAAMVIENDRLYDEVRALAVEGERHALAREMHDSLAQVLAFVNTKAQAVELYLAADDVRSARAQMAELSAAAREVYADIRQGISALRVEIGDRSLPELIADYARDFAETSGLVVDVDVDWTSPASTTVLAPGVELQIFRIVQEALANVRRHAAAGHVRVHATAVAGGFDLVVADDGRGFDRVGVMRDGRPRFGLQTMRERASAIGGELTVESSPDRGTQVRLRLPLADGLQEAEQ